ncbi:DNA alkylation repair protein [Spiroplasma endosymbiont of Othius punctulatus]|uniref:DNA alkylation repair protein n=1 Tax=Spiroplasma endosymbiont of Othius punctulatus TaxID=3066289 RepID=UPI0030D0FA13
MAELLKNKINYELISELAARVKSVYEPFQTHNFINDVIDKTWERTELKARIRKITINLYKYLPNKFEQAIDILNDTIITYPNGYSAFVLMSFPDYVELYGQGDSDWDLSVESLKRYTQYSTSEFAVRAFILKDEKKMIQQMIIWSTSENEHVRRLASEGCRPQLPWGNALISFKKNPTPILDILGNLKNDPSLYVRKSVGNNLNDISKTHPDLVVSIAKSWYGKSKNTDWIIKHGCRTLLKKGNRSMLDIFGFESSDYVTITNFILNNYVLTIGEEVVFSFDVIVTEQSKIRIEYEINYVKANGKSRSKTFQISESILRKNNKKTIKRKHSFADLSTRKHYPGKHSITLILNGVKQGTIDFEIFANKKMDL